MLFNSFGFLFAFLPITLIGYFWLNRLRLLHLASVWLLAASLFFYAWWDVRYLPLIVVSILVNFLVGRRIGKPSSIGTRKVFLWCGILFNLSLLGYYKYALFITGEISRLFDLPHPEWHLTLPLGISFFTFTQIAYLVDTYRKEVKEYHLVNYGLFVTYFPHLLAGPILHHKEMMWQFRHIKNRLPNYRHLSQGLLLFALGLAKKVLLADYLADWANTGYAQAADLNAFEAWFTSLSYSLQLYLDFSGYTDMAIGISLMFNIRLPINFNSPYKAHSIQDFWRRWHITLSRFLRDYVYIPLGGNRNSSLRTYENLFATFVIGGIWHGAGWTFIIWGALHGAAMALHRWWDRLGLSLPASISWALTFLFVNLTWVFFRAPSVADALAMCEAMIGLHDQRLMSARISIPHFKDLLPHFQSIANAPSRADVVLLFGLLLTVLWLPNSMEIMKRHKPSLLSALLVAALLVASMLVLRRESEFLYFNF